MRFIFYVFVETVVCLPHVEYLAPEFVCNMGHDGSVDLWALGVLIYEMFVSSTPFAAKRPDNVTELFTNITNVKVCG